MADRNSRPLEWYDSRQASTTLLAGAQANLTLYNAVSHGPRNLKGATITRLIIDFALSASSVGQRSEVFWGIVLMNADARAAGAFPDADDFTDRADWMVRVRSEVSQLDLTDSSQWDRRRLDLKSQRIIHSEEDELQFIIDSVSAFSCIWTLFVRALVRLP